MSFYKKLTVQQLTQRILANIPELNYSFVESTIKRKNKDLGMEVVNVQDWLYLFDSIVIDGREEIHEKAETM